jgi:hypothetical protein
MTATLMSAVLGNLGPILLGLAVALGLARPGPRGRAGSLLSWILFLPMGLGSLYAGIMHLAFPEVAARFIGWQPSPFQFEVGVANLAVGITSLLAVRASPGFRAAAVVAGSVWLLGDAVGHVQQMLNAADFAPGNAGPVFWMDVAAPALMLALLLPDRRAA